MRRVLTSCSVFSAGMMLLSCTRLLAQTTPPAAPAPTPATQVSSGINCGINPDPYTNDSCLDAYLGTNLLDRFINYYALELGHASAPSDPNAPPGRRADWPTTPETTPPMPFTEWPYGGATDLGVVRPNSVDSPLMTAIANTSVGQLLTDAHIQIYGWVDPGFNISSTSQKPGGNAPIAYAYTPNTVQLDQAVLYVDRFPDTVQSDHVDWGFRFSALYGENYRYTTGYGYFSYQLLKNNNQNGYDFPMVYGEIYVPQVAQGMMIRIGRYISLPDIEAQLAPNNYMYTHSLTYAYDNYTNTGIVVSTALTKQVILQLGLSDGTEAAPWHLFQRVTNDDPNILFPGTSFKKDPGAMPTFTACLRMSWNDEHDNLQPCANGLNSGAWGYNNLQWFGLTYYHKFNDQWHISFEAYNEHQYKIPNANNPEVQTIYVAGGTPFSPQYTPFNGPNLAHCKDVTELTCTAGANGVVAYINYSPDPLDNLSFRPEYYDDSTGQRTGTPADYYELSFGWQHWLSPQIEFRPEVDYYRSIDALAFNGSSSRGVAPDDNHVWFAGGDVIVHF